MRKSNFNSDRSRQNRVASTHGSMNHKQRRLISANRDAPLLNQSVNRFHLVHDELNSEAGINRNNDMSYM